MQETRVRSLGWEDPLEEEMPTHFRTLAWRIPRTDGLQSMGSQRVRHDWATKHATTTWYVLTERRVGSAPCPTPTYTQGPWEQHCHLRDSNSWIPNLYPSKKWPLTEKRRIRITWHLEEVLSRPSRQERTLLPSSFPFPYFLKGGNITEVSSTQRSIKGSLRRSYLSSGKLVHGLPMWR